MTPAVWAATMLGTTALIYAVTAGAYYFNERPGMTVAFVGYVIGNCGLIWDALK